jgi:hypothetical protein
MLLLVYEQSQGTALEKPVKMEAEVERKPSV